jgi:SAM-dependent methyltransferase
MRSPNEALEGVPLLATRCAICGTLGNATELYPANFDQAALNPAVFSARRLPDRVHFRLVRCHSCGLIRSDPIVDPEIFQRLYARSSFDYAGEVANLRRTYGHYLERVRRLGPSDRLLEIGCGNGFFLDEARRRGVPEVWGVEPSAAAVEQAPADLRPRIIRDVMRPGLFAADSFDVVCLFQVFDHIPEPAALLEECYRILRPGGMVLCLNHNAAALSARVLGEKSPIIDIEHTYLYSPETLRRLFMDAGFLVVESGRAWNRYSLYYLARLVPLPARLKAGLLRWLHGSGIGKVPLWVSLGNLYQIARKPDHGARG